VQVGSNRFTVAGNIRAESTEAGVAAQCFQGNRFAIEAE
jgi:hypothetical protein